MADPIISFSEYSTVPLGEPTPAPSMDYTGTEAATSAAKGAIEGAGLFTPYSYKSPDTGELQGYVKPGESYMTPSSMVSTQLSNLLQKESPLMSLAETRAREEANRMGLLSSSMAVGAGQRAVLEAALPIAQQDAATISALQKAQQATEGQIAGMAAEGKISGAIKEQEAGLTSQQAKFQAGLSAEQVALQSKLNTEQQRNVAAISNTYDTAMQNLKALQEESIQTNLSNLNNQATYQLQTTLSTMEDKLKRDLQTEQISAETVENARGASNDLLKNYQLFVESMLKDPNFTQLPPETIQNVFNTQLNSTISSIQFISDSASLNIEDYLNTLNEDLTWEVQESLAT